MRYLIITIVLIFFFISCSRDSEDSWHIIHGFPTPIELQGEHILENEFGVLLIISAHSYIITSTIRDTIFHVYNKNYEYLGGFGQQGQGPYEFREVGLINQLIEHDNRVIVFAIDYMIRKIYGFDLLSTLNSDELVVLYDYELPWELAGANINYQVDEDTIIGTYHDHFYQRLDGKYGLFYYYPATDSIEIFPLYNLDIYSNGGHTVTDPFPRININAHASAISPDRSKFAIQLVYTPRLEITTIGDPQPSRFLLKSKPPKEDFVLESIQQYTAPQYYIYIQATDNYIYLLYSGHSEADDEVQQLEKIVQVIDWNGKPHRQFLIPAQYDITLFTVDEENGYFYGLSHTTDKIYRFDFGSIVSEFSLNN